MVPFSYDKQESKRRRPDLVQVYLSTLRLVLESFEGWGRVRETINILKLEGIRIEPRREGFGVRRPSTKNHRTTRVHRVFM